MNIPSERRKLPKTPIAKLKSGRQYNSSEVTDSDAQTPIFDSVRPRRTSSFGYPTAITKADYKKAAYLDTRRYSGTLVDENELGKVFKDYLTGNGEWYEVARVIADTERKTKNEKSRIRKGPWMKNRRENHNMRKAKIYQFTRKAYKQN